MRDSLEQLKLVIREMKKQNPNATYEEAIEIIHSAENKQDAFTYECGFLIEVIQRWIIESDTTICKMYYTDLIGILNKIIETETNN